MTLDRPKLPLNAPTPSGEDSNARSAHFTILAFPFRHHLPASGWQRRRTLTKAGRCWQHWWQRLHGPEGVGPLQRALDDTYFFLPYVREMLFPEVTGWAGDASEHPERAKRLASLSLAEIDREIARDSVLRLTAREQLIAPLRDAELTFELGTERFAACVTTDWVDVLLFPQGIGLLALKTRLLARDGGAPESLTTDDVADYHWYAKQVHQLTLGWQQAVWHFSLPEGGALSCHARDLVDALLLELASLQPAPATDLIDTFTKGWRGEPTWGKGLREEERAALAPRVLQVQSEPRLRYTSTHHGQTYGDAFSIYSFLSLADPAPADEPPTTKHSPFASRLEQACFEIVQCVDSSLPEYVPHTSALKQFREKNLIERWNNWVGATSQDRVAFIATDQSGFVSTLANNVESDYFYLFALTQFQRVRLSVMFGDLVRGSQTLLHHVRAARKLWDAYMAFENRYWFTEVSRKTQGHLIYRHLHASLDVADVHEELSREISDLQAHYERKAERLTATTLFLLAVVGLPVGTLVGFFANTKAQDPFWQDFVLTGVGAYFGLLGLLWLARRFFA